MKKLLCMLFITFCNLYSQTSADVYNFPTIYGKKIIYKERGGSSNAYISIDSEILFSTVKDSNGDFERLGWAGSPYSKDPIQKKRIPTGKVCLRWVIEVFGADDKKHYIVDFTQAKPFVVGPFKTPDSSDEVAAVYWGKIYALIKFKSHREFKYFYEEKNVVEN